MEGPWAPTRGPRRAGSPGVGCASSAMIRRGVLRSAMALRARIGVCVRETPTTKNEEERKKRKKKKKKERVSSGQGNNCKKSMN